MHAASLGKLLADVLSVLPVVSCSDSLCPFRYAITPGLSWFLGFLKVYLYPINHFRFLWCTRSLPVQFNHTAVVVNDETSPGLVLALMNISLLMFSRRKQLCGCCSRRRRKRRFVYPPLVDSTSAKGTIIACICLPPVSLNRTMCRLRH